MSKMLFLKEVSNDYFNERTFELENIENMIKPMMPIFGTLETSIEKTEQGSKLIFKDIDKADMYISTNGKKPNEEDCDMSSIPLILTLDNNNKVVVAEHGISFFTTANKDLVLFIGALIGKKIKLPESELKS